MSSVHDTQAGTYFGGRRSGPRSQDLDGGGPSANWMPSPTVAGTSRASIGNSVRIVWIWQGIASGSNSRNHQAVFLSAFSTGRATANLLVRPIATKRIATAHTWRPAQCLTVTLP